MGARPLRGGERSGGSGRQPALRSSRPDGSALRGSGTWKAGDRATGARRRLAQAGLRGRDAVRSASCGKPEPSSGGLQPGGSRVNCSWGPARVFLAFFMQIWRWGGKKGRSQGRVIRGGLVTILLVWFSVENAPHALPERELCPRLLQMLLIVCSRIILNNKQTNRHAWQLRPTGGRAERWLQEMGLPRGTQRVAWPPGPGGNALRPPRGPGHGLFDPGLKFLLFPGAARRNCFSWSREPQPSGSL